MKRLSILQIPAPFCQFIECCTSTSDMSISWPTPVINAQDLSRNAAAEHVHGENSHLQLDGLGEIPQLDG
ncbi:hypothetical protein HDV64DRAFT_3089 [Trichoderma sp. TUCIM 5745]